MAPGQVLDQKHRLSVPHSLKRCELQLKRLHKNTARLLHVLRNWRNYIHPKLLKNEYPDGFPDRIAEIALSAGKLAMEELTD